MRPWLFSQTIPADKVAATVDLAAEAGCDLLLRCGHAWGNPSNSLKNPPERIIEAAAACARRGIRAGLWSWPHPDHLDAHFREIQRASESWKPAVYVSDVEHSDRSPWKTHPQKEAMAARLIDGHRNRGMVPHVVTSYGAVFFHRPMPWRQLLPPGVPFMGQWQTVDAGVMERSLAELPIYVGRTPEIWPCGGLQDPDNKAQPRSPESLRAHQEDHARVFGGVRAYWTLEMLKKAEGVHLAEVIREAG